MVNELNSEMAMAIVNRMKSNEGTDRLAMLAVLRQVQTTLRSLSKADRLEKPEAIHISNGRTVTAGTH